MKNIIAWFAVIVLLFFLSGCDGGGSSGSSDRGYSGSLAESEKTQEQEEVIITLENAEDTEYTVELSDDDNYVKEYFKVNLYFSRLDNETNQSLAGFEFFLKYNSDVVEFYSVTYGQDLGDTELSEADTYHEVVSTGLLFFKEVSRLSTEKINNNFQPDELLLVTITFYVFSDEKIDLSTLGIVFSDADGNEILPKEEI